MREPIETAPRNGEFLIIEDGTRGTIAVARWSAEASQWLYEDGVPSQLSATHWHSAQDNDGECTPSQLNATYWRSLTPAQGADAPGWLLAVSPVASAGAPGQLHQAVQP